LHRCDLGRGSVEEVVRRRRELVLGLVREARLRRSPDPGRGSVRWGGVKKVVWRRWELVASPDPGSRWRLIGRGRVDLVGRLHRLDGRRHRTEVVGGWQVGLFDRGGRRRRLNVVGLWPLGSDGLFKWGGRWR
jgi:hypothetical protein